MLIECEPRAADCAAVHLCGFSRACVRFRQLLQVVFLLVRKISLVSVCKFLRPNAWMWCNTPESMHVASDLRRPRFTCERLKLV